MTRYSPTWLAHNSQSWSGGPKTLPRNDRCGIVGAWCRDAPNGTTRPQRVWTLHAGEHAAAIERKPVPGIGAGIRAEPRVRDPHRWATLSCITTAYRSRTRASRAP